MLVFINEVKMTDSSDVDAMKSLITEDSISLELKKRDPVRIPNFARYIFSSNHSHSLLADARERRYLVIEPNMPYDPRSQEYRDYFVRLNQWIDNGGSSKLLYFFQNHDISRFNPFSAPTTSALIEQKVLSMKPVHEWLCEWISSEGEKHAGTTTKCKVLSDSYVEWKFKNCDKKITSTKAGREVGAEMESMGIRKEKRGNMIFDLPDIQSLKSRFARIFNAKIEDIF